MQILDSLVPIFAVIGLGMLLRKRGFLTADATKAFNQFAYWWSLPLFLFYKLTAAEVSASANRLAVTLMIAVAATFAVAWALSIVTGVPSRSRGAAIQSAFRGNLAFIGLPLILFSIADLPSGLRQQMESTVFVSLPPVIVFHNIASVVALAFYNDQQKLDQSLRSMLINVVTNPLIAACLGGVLFQYAGWNLPTAASRTFEVVGASAFPIALVGIGSQLISISVKRDLAMSIMPTLVKCILCPILALAAGTTLGLAGTELLIAMILCGCPTAVSSYVMVDQMRGDAELAASSVVICTAFSMLSLSAILLAGTWIAGT